MQAWVKMEQPTLHDDDEGSQRGGGLQEGEREGEAALEAGQRWTFDEALAHVGGWGRFQHLSVLYCGFPWLISGMFAFGPVTFGADMLRENEWGGCSHEQAANSLYFAANFVGNAFFGPFADAVGRRKGMMVSLGITALGGCMCIMAHTFPIYLLARSIVGFGNAGVCLISSVLISEVVSADVRSLVVCFYLQIFFAGK
jgi:MFS family permease